MSNVLIFLSSLAATILVSAGLLWLGTKWISGFEPKAETVFWVSVVTQVYRCAASLVMQFVLPRHPVAGFVLILCSMVYVQALALRLAVGIASHEISLIKAHVISLLTVLIGFAGFIPLIAWTVARFSAH